MKQLKQLQQGDVNIALVDVLPEDIKKINTNIIREGETTGHAHRIQGTDFRLYQLGAIILAEMLSDDCRIEHEEHGTIELPKGKYAFSPVVEYDHFAERARFVLD